MLVNEKGLPYFYKITNKLNGKYYYGSGQKTGYYGSGFALHKAYEKYGRDQFTYEILRYFDTRQHAFRFEQLFLSIYKLDSNPMSYNACRNANGGYVSEEHYENVSRFMKQRDHSGLNNTRADRNVYEFYNIDTGEFKNATVYEMNKFVNGEKPRASMFGYIVRGDRKIHQGWILAENIDKWGNRDLLDREHRENLSSSKKDKKFPKISEAKKGARWWTHPETRETKLCHHQPDGFILGRLK